MSNKKEKCDVCEKKQGFQDFNLKTCKECNVLVHDCCYGVISDEEDTNWTCLACTYSKENSIARPTKCELCSVDGGVHAMHPLYDKSGKKGRMIGWVHTLCALFVGTNPITSGTVFACDKKGRYNGDDVDDMSTDSDESDESDNSVNFAQVHHFVICNVNENSPWARAIHQSRKLRCFYCGNADNDTSKPSLRIPVQCTSGDAHEFKPFQKRIKSVNNIDDSCVVAMHVGCARWMENERSYQRVFFYPGESRPERLKEKDVVADALCCAYCDAHAEILRRTRPIKNISQVHLPKRTKPAIESKKKETSLSPEKQKDLAETIVTDLLKRIREAENKISKESIVTSESKAYWKTELIRNQGMSPKDFKNVWNIVKVDFEKKLENPWKSLWMPTYEANEGDGLEWYRS